jgi:hypothetical protein
MVKKIAVVAAFLCAATVVNAQDEGMKIGARVGYSSHSLGESGANAGTLGIGGGLAISIPAGPIVIAPEVAFLYRDLMTFDFLGTKMSYTEMAISVPIMVKYSIVESAFAQAGVQLDIPFNSQACVDSDCLKADGKELPYKRKSFDLGIAFGAGYIINPNLSVDARYVLGLMPAYEWEFLGVKSDFGSVSTLVNAGVTYYF